MINKKTETRKFLGKTEGFEHKKEKLFYQRMLKAYLAGHQYFHYGFKMVGNRRVPEKHIVLSNYNASPL